MHASQPAPLVITTDRAAIDRQYRPVVVVGAVAVLVVAATTVVAGVLGGASFTAAPEAAPVLAVVLAVVTIAAVGAMGAIVAVATFQWGVLRSLGDRVVADASGMRMHLPIGRVHVPWSAVRGARVTGSERREVLRLDVDVAAIAGDLSDRHRRAVASKGLAFGAVGMQPGVAALANAIAAGTAGRVVPQRG